LASCYCHRHRTCGFRFAAEPPSATNHYEFRAVHDRDGIGKFYLGREIAHVMGHQAADWLERPERDEEEKTELLVETLKFKPGEAVADIGAGTGYFTRRIAKRVAPNGTVFAVEIQQEMLDLLTNKMAELKITNVKPVLGTVSDPKLPAGSIDTILMVDVYHEFDHPFEMVDAMCRALKRGGRIAFVEFRAEDESVPIKRLHKMTEAQVKKEMSVHSLDWSDTDQRAPAAARHHFQKALSADSPQRPAVRAHVFCGINPARHSPTSATRMPGLWRAYPWRRNSARDQV
jgi:SAM-dependent methyltransferase